MPENHNQHYLPQKSVMQRINSAALDKNQDKFHVKDLFLKSDLHGLPEWYEANGCLLKTTWSIIMVVCLLGLSFELWHVIDDFQNNPILTTYRLVADPGKLDFPVIYLCPSAVVHQAEREMANVDEDWEKKNVQGMMKSHADDNGLHGILASKFTISETLLKYQPPPVEVSNEPLQPSHPPRTPRTPPPKWIPKDVEDYFMRVGYKLNTFFQECAWNAKAIPCDRLATPIFDGDHGKCFAVRPPVDDPKQRTAGVGFSFVLSLDFEYAHSNEQPPLFDGFIMKISHDIDFASHNSVLLSPGLYTKARLSAEKFNLIKRKNGKVPQSCIDEDVGRNNLTELAPRIYTHDICYQDCVQQVVVRECECHMPVDKWFLKNDSIALCNVANLTNCAYEAIGKFNETISDCALWCRVPCTSWSYQVDTSSAKFPSAALKQIIESPRIRDATLDYEEFTTTPQPNRPRPLAAALRRRLFQDTTTDYDEDTTSGAPPPIEESNLEQTNTQQSLTDGAPSSETQSPPQPKTQTTSPDDFPSYGDITTEFEEYTTSAQDRDREAKFMQWRWGKGDLLILDIAYSSLQYTDVTQDESMTFSTFVSNIGGQVGLWIGASIVTMIKFFVLLTPLCCRRKKVRDNRNGDA